MEYKGTRRNTERSPPSPLRYYLYQFDSIFIVHPTSGHSNDLSLSNSIHHMPVLITLCFVDENGTFVVDPNREEEAISTGQVHISERHSKMDEYKIE